MLPEHCIPEAEKRSTQVLEKFTQQRGEPLIGEVDPAQLRGLLDDLGWELIEDLDVDEQARRYFSSRSDDLRPWAASSFAHAMTRRP